MARALAARGTSDRPATDDYVLAFWSRGFIPGLDHDWKRGLVAALLDDPTHLAADVERLFEIEGTSELSLASHDKYAKNVGAKDGRPVPMQFGPALKQLTDDGRLERQRMLDLSLAALGREWPAFRPGRRQRSSLGASPRPPLPSEAPPPPRWRWPWRRCRSSTPPRRAARSTARGSSKTSPP